MPGDYSRFTDDPRKRFAQVLMQQGRVTLDSDQNELMEILTRRDRLQALDTFGFRAVPRATTPDAFRITAAGADLAIGAGRMYVDGVLAEAFASDPLTYRTQPFFRAPDPPAINTLPAGRGLVYLDVWEREITALEDPSLLEPALGGVDTTTRTQTIWQVKIAPGTTLDCSSDLNQAFPPSPARLTVSVNIPAEPPDPCLPVESGGFRDVENRHYRVEIHGSSSPAKYKFSRDPVAVEIEDIVAGAPGETILKVKRTGLDSVLRFSEGDAVEVLNEARVLSNTPGIMARIKKIKEETREITIDVVVAATEKGVDANNRELRARLIRWDQKGTGATDPLNTVGAGKMALENGIEIEITGAPRHGDYWMFPARVATHSAGPLVSAPPRGVIHHYAPLAMVNGLGSSAPVVESDCRTLWPPLGGAGEDCECTSCVTAEDHNSGRHTIAMAIAEAKLAGGGKVCLKPGVYEVDDTIEIRNAQFLRLTGHGWAVLAFSGRNEAAPVILADSSADIAIEGLIILRAVMRAQAEAAAVVIHNCLLNVVVQDCVIVMLQVERGEAPSFGIAIKLDGIVQDTHIQRNVLVAGTGVGTELQRSQTILLGLDVNENLMFAGQGVALAPIALSVDASRNWIVGEGGFLLRGFAVPGGGIVVDKNRIFAQRTAIVFETDRTVISNNTISGTFDPSQPPSVAGFGGLIVDGAHAEDDVVECSIIGNQFTRIKRSAIQARTVVRGLLIKQNHISTIGGGGIILSEEAAGSTLTIENNEIVDVVLEPVPREEFNAAIHVPPRARAAISANTISGVGQEREGQRLQRHVAIRAEAPEMLRVHENRIDRVLGATFPSSAAIEVVLPAGAVEITNNIVSVSGLTRLRNSHCYTILIGVPRERRFSVVHREQPQADTRPAAGMAAGTRAFLIAPIIILGLNAFRLDPGVARALIRANQLECNGPFSPDASGVHVEGSGAESVICTFGGNQCVSREDITFDDRLRVWVRAKSQTFVGDANQILGAGQAIEVGDVPWTLVGNIVDAPIRVGTEDFFTSSVPAIKAYAAINRRI